MWFPEIKWYDVVVIFSFLFTIGYGVGKIIEFIVKHIHIFWM